MFHMSKLQLLQPTYVAEIGSKRIVGRLDWRTKTYSIHANQHYSDMCQATYRTPKLYVKSTTAMPGLLIGSEHGSPFERDLIGYFRAYGMKVTEALCLKLQMYDFSCCKV
jgi:hypothetical protein